ncbi:hypothetical protein EB118_04120 [bacterium]|nr:hypothetical protein [bacterium]
MSYNPPTQQIVDNDTRNTASNEAIFEALKNKADTNLQNLSFSGSNGNVLTLSGGIPVWAAPAAAGVTSVSATAPLASSGGSTPTISITQVSGDANKVLASDGTAASWQYAGLGAGSLGTNNVILGRSKPTNLTGIGTTIVGVGAGNALTTANGTIAIGSNALTLQTTASENVAIGGSAGQYSVSTGQNTFVGTYAGRGNADGVSSTGANNTFLGYSAGLTITSGGSNSAVGMSALNAITTGFGNTAMGHATATAVNTQNANTSIGYAAGRYVAAASNTFIGYSAGTGVSGSSTGTNNVGIGVSSLTALTTASGNVAIGRDAGLAITTGSSNTVMGNGAGGANLTTGSGNVCIGNGAVLSVNGSDAVVIGNGALVPGGVSVAIGSGAKTDGDQAISIGYQAYAGNARSIAIGRASLTTNADNIVIGHYARISGPGVLIVPNGNNQTQAVANSIGLNGICQVANSTLIGNSLNLYFNNHGSQRVSVAALSENQIFANSYITGGATNNGNASGGIFTINGAQGTGTGIGGDIRFKTAPPGAVSNNVQNALVEQVRITYDGKVGINTNTPAEKLEVVGNIKVTSGGVNIDTVGKGLTIKSGSDAKIGVATFTNVSSVTVSTTAVTANSIILITTQSGGYAPMCVNSIIAGTSFVIQHNNTFTGTVAWMIVERS